MAQKSSTKTVIFIISALTVGMITYLCWDYYAKENVTVPQITKTQPEQVQQAPKEIIPDQILPDATPEEEASDLGMTTEFSDPKGLVKSLVEQLRGVKNETDLKQLAHTLGNGEVNKEQLAHLQKLFAENRLQLSDKEAMKLIGELKAGKKSRWALKLKDGSSMQLDIARQANGKWKVDDVKLPISNLDANGVPLSSPAIIKRQLELNNKDAMNYTHNFMNVLTSLDFEQARSMVNSSKISDAKIAGLCILFEDGKYAMRADKPLQAIRLKEDISAFFANVVSKDDVTQKGAQFSITAVRDSKDRPWSIDEINLDRLLEDYAKRVAGGDVYYTPLIKNPNGGESLVIYFDFDSEGLNLRTKKQLDIVSRLLKLDESKKVILSGHTDAKGSNDYNQGLSIERAKAVKAYLKESGIGDPQIVTEAHGFSKPRRPDTKVDGSDDPSARRANRRTEIYLDF